MDESTALSLLGGLEFDDSRTYTLLEGLIREFYALDRQINPSTRQSFGSSGVQIPGVNTVVNFQATIYSNNVRLTWDSLDGTSYYEVRYKLGSAIASDWAIANSILRTSTTSADINPVAIPLTTGNHTFLIKATNASGITSTTAATVVINIPLISAPTINATVIGNHVLLKWTEPISVFEVNYYNVYKGGVLQGIMDGTFEAIFETVGGTFSYTVEGVDIVGNVGAPSPAVVVQVSNPDGFILQDTKFSTLTGVKVNTIVENIGFNALLANLDLTETWQSHFTSRGWTTPQNQIDAGFPIYCQPSQLTGSYTEVFDFGAIFNNIIVGFDWNTIAVSGVMGTSTSTIEVSTDGFTYSAPVIGTSLFASAIRYVRWTMKFVAPNTTTLAYYYNIKSMLQIHLEDDGGNGACLASDVDGTVFVFSKVYKFVKTITAVPISTESRFTVVNFDFSTLNPTQFKVLVYDNAGVRKDSNISWNARGIIQ